LSAVSVENAKFWKNKEIVLALSAKSGTMLKNKKQLSRTRRQT
jgi:hypothetical protein